MKPIYLVVGIPASGKSWVCEQISNQFNYIPHDVFPKIEAYAKQIETDARQSKALNLAESILIETPFSVSKLKDPLEAKGYQIVPVFIVDSPELITERYMERFKDKTPEEQAKGKKQLQGNLARQETYKKRAQELKAFSGNSSEVLEYLKNVSKN